MRPEAEPNGVAEYECFNCGARTQSPDVRHCAECGGELKNLGRSRDL